MAKSLRVQLSISGESVSLSNVFNLTDNKLIRAEIAEEEFAASATAKELEVAVDISECTFLSIRPTVDVTLNTNSSGSSADDTLELKANQGITWWDGCGFALDDVFTADITKMYFDNDNETTAGSIQVVVLEDGTP